MAKILWQSDCYSDENKLKTNNSIRVSWRFAVSYSRHKKIILAVDIYFVWLVFIHFSPGWRRNNFRRNMNVFKSVSKAIHRIFLRVFSWVLLRVFLTAFLRVILWDLKFNILIKTSEIFFILKLSYFNQSPKNYFSSSPFNWNN